jgi:hypothetical protein
LVAGCGARPKLVVLDDALGWAEGEEESKSKRNKKGSFTQRRKKLMTMTERESKGLKEEVSMKDIW